MDVASRTTGGGYSLQSQSRLPGISEKAGGEHIRSRGSRAMVGSSNLEHRRTMVHVPYVEHGVINAEDACSFNDINNINERANYQPVTGASPHSINGQHTKTKCSARRTRQAAPKPSQTPEPTPMTMDAALSDRKRKADVFEWEASKENVVPLKRGRNVADLNKALRAHDSFQTKLRLEDELKTKENAVEAYDGDDPLSAWIEYVRWLEVKMPEDTRKKFTVLEKCTRELKDNPRYKNDMRYIRLWIQYVKPQDLLERKYKEFQRRMSRQWLRMTEETGANGVDEVTHRRALDSLSAYGTLELNDAQRQQLHQHRSSARAQRIQKANAHKPVFVIYEDPVGHSVDPFDGNGGWKKLGTMQQQDKENEMAPSAWNTLGARGETGAGADRQPDRRSPPALSSRPQDASPLEVFVDEEFSVPENELATEEEMLAQEPLKNFAASDKKARMQKQETKGRSEKSCYDVEQITSTTGEAISFEEIRARTYQRSVDKSRKLGHRALQDVTRDVDSASNVTSSSSAATSSATASIVSHRVNLSERKPATTLATSPEVKLPERKPNPIVITAQSDAVSTHNGEQEDMTINTRVALEDINNMFCSPPRESNPSVWDAKEDDPVERKLHFSVFDDSVDSVAVNAQDQSQRQDPNESIPKQAFQRDHRGIVTAFAADLVIDCRAISSDNKTCDVSLHALYALANRLTSRNITQPTAERATLRDHLGAKVPTPALELDPYTFENRQTLILDRRVDWYLCSRPDAVKLHSEMLPRVPCSNPLKRKLRKPVVFKASPTLTLQLVGVLGSGSFAYVFSAKVVDTTSNTTCNKAVKIEKERQNLAWEFYITNKIKKKVRIENKLPDEKIPVPTFTGLHLFPVHEHAGVKGHFGTLFDVLNCYKQVIIPFDLRCLQYLKSRCGYVTPLQWGITFPEVLAVYYGIKMLRCIEMLHSAKVLHGDIKPDNWLMIPGNPSSELSMITQEPHTDKDFHAGDLHLIDYGRSIDLSLYPREQFSKATATQKASNVLKCLRTARGHTKSTRLLFAGRCTACSLESTWKSNSAVTPRVRRTGELLSNSSGIGKSTCGQTFSTTC
ncbi:Mitotic spindle checkpoint protein Bub1/Mad3 [Phytophthora cactorum]|nr:Mitotic spindle checkpoint protein Bub1/Mad3 [Phytophthora cactorum]